MNHLTAEVAVVGAGPAGLTAAIALASAGVETVLIARSPNASDVRTSALLAGSVKALRKFALPRARSASMLLATMSKTGFSSPRWKRAPANLPRLGASKMKPLRSKSPMSR